MTTWFQTRNLIVGAILIALIASAFVAFAPPKLARKGAIAQLLPSVVRITTHSIARPETASSPAMETSEPSTGGQKVEESFGSGFIIDKDGYIVTNRHVVHGAYEIIVTLNDRSSLQARLIGEGTDVDLALLKISTTKPLQPVAFGDSTKLALGDEVIVVGNPYGLGTTVTSGVISALNRDLGLSMFDSFIQTDAPINRGNSGGPLFNMEGDVIGVNTAYYNGGNQKGGSIGLGFAIPSETTREVARLLRKYGYTKVGWIGVDGATLSPQISNALGIPEQPGVIVAHVQPGGPAEAVLASGDIVLTIDGHAIEDMRMLRRDVAASLGKPLKFSILRAGRPLTLTITPVEWPRARSAEPMPPPPEIPAKFATTDLGARWSTISEEARRQFDIPPTQRGVVVTDLVANSPAAESGLQIGDVLLDVQSLPVTDPSEIKARIAAALAAKRDYVVMLVRSRDQYRYIALPIAGEAASTAAAR